MAHAVYFVTGKGGVGKSTIAGALTQHGDILATLEARPRPPRGTQVVLEGEACRQAVAAKILRSKTAAALLFRSAHVRTLLELSDALTAVAALDRLRELATRSRVVFDMPATGHALSWFRSLSILERLAGGGPLQRFVAELRRWLREGPHRLWIVSTPEPFVLAETQLLIDAARELPDPLQQELVLNRVPPELEALSENAPPHARRLVAQWRSSRAHALRFARHHARVHIVGRQQDRVASELAA